MKKEKICQLDERQLQQYAAVNTVVAWTAYGVLCAALLIQTALGSTFAQIAGELVTLLAVSGVMIVGYLKYGIWDKTQQYSLKKNALLSLAASLLAGAAMGISSYRNYHKPVGSLAAAVFVAFFTFLLCIAAIQLCWAGYKKRQRWLENAEDAQESADRSKD